MCEVQNNTVLKLKMDIISLIYFRLTILTCFQNLTGGPKGGKHITDVTNASRTFLMNIETLYWDSQLLNLFKIPRTLLPEIRSSSEIYGTISEGWPLSCVKISGVRFCFVQS